MKLNDPQLKIRIDHWYTTFPPLTPWFKPNVHPVRVGVYMVDQSWPGVVEQPVFSWWDGQNWYPQGSMPKDAIKFVCYGAINRETPFSQWRGLKGENK